jgi:hypothetical protein
MRTAIAFLTCVLAAACNAREAAPAPKPAPAAPQPIVSDDLKRRVSALITDLEARERASQLSSPPQIKRIDSYPEETASQRQPADYREQLRQPQPAARYARPGTSAVDLMQARAISTFGPALNALRNQGRSLEQYLRRYIAACYARVNRSSSPGAGTDMRFLRADGTSAAWNPNSILAWRDSWASQAGIDPQTAVICREMWTDISLDGQQLRNELVLLDQRAMAAGIYPGVMRSLRASYGFYE